MSTKSRFHKKEVRVFDSLFTHMGVMWTVVTLVALLFPAALIAAWETSRSAWQHWAHTHPSQLQRLQAETQRIGGTIQKLVPSRVCLPPPKRRRHRR